MQTICLLFYSLCSTKKKKKNSKLETALDTIFKRFVTRLCFTKPNSRAAEEKEAARKKFRSGRFYVVLTTTKPCGRSSGIDDGIKIDIKSRFVRWHDLAKEEETERETKRGGSIQQSVG